jgi:hypothetical protein
VGVLLGVLSEIRTLLTSSKYLYLDQKVVFSSIFADYDIGRIKVTPIFKPIN